ncbi:hypothetical protein ACGFZP_31280 [Kitasatospora sp. NPDC048239]|uniref:hypothetical protein n=1 Tax=Kitasatospora sp. NPDC048239 TaxID=3364046 RepID=UPI00371E8988
MESSRQARDWLTPRRPRVLLRAWAEGQHRLWLGYEAEGARPFGLDADEHAAVLALCDLSDDERAQAIRS